MVYKNRYIYDVLYGKITLPEYLWEILKCPEVQRLREVRMCNINSLCLTGGANINRYEHSIGTSWLAIKCMERLKVDNNLKRIFTIAALVHDIGSTAFGHSVQYVIDKEGYQHESIIDILGLSKEITNGYSYQRAKVQPIYFGMPKRLTELLTQEEIVEVSNIVSGYGTYGRLINGVIDLDNIDNVFRLAYHIGLIRDNETPLKLAQSLIIQDNKIVIIDSFKDLLLEWYNVRKKMYNYLLLNPDEFSAKCMLEEALSIAQKRSNVSFFWHDVDYELLMKLNKSTDEVNNIISRLAIGDLYGCIGIYSFNKTEMYPFFFNYESKQEHEKEISMKIRGLKKNLKNSIVALHVIKDVNKTQRRIEMFTDKGELITIGTPTNRLLLGVFLKNAHYSMSKINPTSLEKWGVKNQVRNWLQDIVKTEVEEIDLYEAEGQK